MSLKSEIGYKPFSEESANERLRWFIGFLKEDTWKNHPYFKIVTAWNVEDILRCAGYEWQADRVKNHLYRWMKSISLLEKGSSDKVYSQKEDLFFGSENDQNKANLGLIQACRGQDPARRPEAETRIIAKKIVQRISVDTLREESFP